MRRLRVVGMLMGIVILFVGCGSKEKEEQIEIIETTIISERLEKAIDIESKEFNLGQDLYLGEENKEMPYEVRGIISAPKIGEKMPVVFLIHGSYDNENTGVRFDTGFKYITEYLAKNGYLAIGLDVQNAYVWRYGDNNDNKKITEMVNTHLDKLKEANEGKNNKYGIELKDKIDFENLILVGHSRGGETIFDVANNLQEKGQKVKGLISIAPTAIVLDTAFLKTDINTGIVVPEYDGDVIDLSGLSIYDILNTKQRENIVQCTYLEKANHNYFNNNLKKNDTELLGKVPKDQLSKTDQQNFLKNYIVDFLDFTIKGVKENTIYDTSKTSVTKMYGCNVKSLYTDKNTKNILDIKDLDSMNKEKVEIKNIQDSIFYQDDNSYLNSVTGGSDGIDIRELLNIRWRELNGKVSFAPSVKNFKEYNSISFDIIQNPSDELNKEKENKLFKIQIKDTKGKVASVDLNKDVAALKYIDGKLEDLTLDGGKEYKNWSKITPITELRVPLKDFKGVNLEKIKEVSLIFDKDEEGAIDISKIQLK